MRDGGHAIRLAPSARRIEPLLAVSKKNYDRFAEISYILDSLGFFNPHLDTVSRDTIIVYPGPRAQVDSLRFEWEGDSIDIYYTPRLPRPYDAGWISDVARRALTRCGEEGRPYARVTLDFDTLTAAVRADSAQGLRLALVVAVWPDRIVGFGRARFTGMRRTREKTLARDAAFGIGDSFDTRAVEQTVERLASRPYIREARAGAPVLISSESGASAHGELPLVAVPIAVVDESGLGIDGAVGFQSSQEGASGITGDFSLDLLNVFGAGESGRLVYRGETGLQELDIDFAKPHLFGTPLVLGGGFGLEIQEESYGAIRGELRCMYELRTRWLAGFAFLGRETTARGPDSVFSAWRVGGVDLLLQRSPERLYAGAKSREISVKTGAHVAERDHGRYYRWLVEFTAGMQWPIFARQAVRVKAVSATMGVDSRDSLHAVEKFRVGGRNSIRGYAENAYAFNTAGYANVEYLYYFSKAGSAYFFLDGGGGYVNQIDAADAVALLGYGVGVRLPVRIGTLSIAWGRNIEDARSFGRVHIGFNNSAAGR